MSKVTFIGSKGVHLLAVILKKSNASPTHGFGKGAPRGPNPLKIGGAPGKPKKRLYAKNGVPEPDGSGPSRTFVKKSGLYYNRYRGS